VWRWVDVVVGEERNSELESISVGLYTWLETKEFSVTIELELEFALNLL